jgi:hypothetical protein
VFTQQFIENDEFILPILNKGFDELLYFITLELLKEYAELEIPYLSVVKEALFKTGVDVPKSSEALLLKPKYPINPLLGT